MKKLMIAAVIVCAAAFTQAASVTWSTATTYKPTSATDGTYQSGVSGSKKVGTAMTMYLWTVDADTFGDTAVDTIYSTYFQDATKLATAETKTSVNSISSIVTDGHARGADVYAFVVLTYSDATLGDWYVANKAWTTIGSVSDDGDNMTVGALNTKIGGETDAKSFDGSGTDITGWTTVPTPEPTSGLLLLLGVAGLALRRRRA